MNKRGLSLVVGIALIAAASGGCSKSELGAEVSGAVTLDGKPVGPGVVIFAPIGAARNPAEGAIQPNGAYFLKTSRTTGLEPGRYKVALSVFEDPKGPPGQRSMELSKLVTPEKYSQHETSGLEYDVKPGKNTIDIPLTSK